MKRKRIFYLLGLILFLTIGSFGFLNAKDKKESKILLHFVQISDTHLQESSVVDAGRLLGSSDKLLKDAVTQINDIKDLDFVLATGDLVDMPKKKLLDKFLEITKDIKYPFYALFGNHDAGVNSELNKKDYIKRFTKVNTISFTDGMPYYSFSPNEKFTIICLDGTTEKVVTAHGQIEDPKQFEWLEKELEANKNKYVIIALHFPLIEPFKSESHFFLEPDRTKLLDLLNSYENVIGVFTGHYHVAKLLKVKNKIHNSCPAVVQYPNAFREILITQDDEKYLNVEFKWHDVDGLELREKSKFGTKNWAAAGGAKEDREDVVKVRIY